MIYKEFLKTEQGGTVVRVTLTLPDGIWADNIYLVGDFNGWDQSSHPMRRNHAGQWTTVVDLQPGRAYQFRYLCDGEWMNDSQADAYVFNPYGSHNFIVVTDPDFRKHTD